MINFFTILLIIFIGILFLILKKRSIKKLLNKENKHSTKFKKIINFHLIKIVFYTITKKKKYSLFYKNSQRNKMFCLFHGDTENKLKALKIAEELADKSTLPILRKGLRDISPEVVEISALLIRQFK